MKDTLPWNAFKCKQEVGEDTFAEWLKSEKLPYEADPVTGSLAEHMRAYQVPVAWARHADTERDQQQLESEGVASATDIANFNSMRAGGSSGDAAGKDGEVAPGGQAMKVEVNTAEEKDREAVNLFVENKQQHMMLLSCNITELKILQVTISEQKFTGTMSKAVALSFGDNLKLMLNKFIKVQKAVEQWAIEPSCLKERGLATLSSQVSMIMVEKRDLMEWADRLNVQPAGPPKKKGRGRGRGSQ